MWRHRKKNSGDSKKIELVGVLEVENEKQKEKMKEDKGYER